MGLGDYVAENIKSGITRGVDENLPKLRSVITESLDRTRAHVEDLVTRIEQRTAEAIIEVRQFLRSVEGATPETLGLAATGDHVLWWSVGRILWMIVRIGWPTLLLFLVINVLNVATWMLLTGWRLAVFRSLFGP